MDAKVIFEIAEKRFAICKECPALNTLLNKCNDCGCLMLLKTKVPAAECPQGKWHKQEIDLIEETPVTVLPLGPVVEKPVE